MTIAWCGPVVVRLVRVSTRAALWPPMASAASAFVSHSHCRGLCGHGFVDRGGMAPSRTAHHPGCGIGRGGRTGGRHPGRGIRRPHVRPSHRPGRRRTLLRRHHAQIPVRVRRLPGRGGHPRRGRGLRRPVHGALRPKRPSAARTACFSATPCSSASRRFPWSPLFSSVS